ncbi:hypothetical protein ACIBJF_14140 [Streptomyces sp. NPDC050743]|uniref:hypothetical protein n=1 Tax=Streptomyces sp. NPDC050743 TaxID=3365634 RepID=UPI00379D0E49
MDDGSALPELLAQDLVFDRGLVQGADESFDVFLVLGDLSAAVARSSSRART